MSKLERLIQQYCPDGVERKTFSEVFETITDYTAAGSFKNIADNVQYLKVPDYAMLIRTTDLKSNFIKGGFIYVSESAFNYLWRVNMDKECIVMPNVGNCGEIYYVQPKDLPYEHCALAPNAILVRSNTQNNRYLSYCLQVEDFQKQLKKITSPVGQSKFNKSELKKLVLPIPPLPVQEEIVRILDAFTELQAELQKRQQQYNFYRDTLLTNYASEQNVKEYCLGELFEFKNGLNASKEQFGHGKPIVNYVNVYKKNSIVSSDLTGRVELDASTIERYRVKRGDVFFTRTSETREEVGFASVLLEDIEDCVFSGFVLRARPITNVILPEFCKYCFATYEIRKQIIQSSTLTTRALTNGTSLSKVKIMIPPLEEQNRIVAILDRFDTLTNDLTSGLPAEMEKRRQQYEYYRDRLLTFKRL